MIRYCINCEEPIPDELLKHSEDFCSPICKHEYNASADPEILARETNSNPDALPITTESWAKPARPTSNANSNKSGILPPNSIEAISALLQTSSNSDIEQAVKNISKDSQNETERE